MCFLAVEVSTCGQAMLLFRHVDREASRGFGFLDFWAFGCSNLWPMFCGLMGLTPKCFSICLSFFGLYVVCFLDFSFFNNNISKLQKKKVELRFKCLFADPV